MEDCGAILWHGPGHQSRTKCQLKGQHFTHYAVYGSDDQEAYWKSGEGMTGFFDEPPQEKNEKEAGNG